MSNQHDTRVLVRWNKYEFLGAPRLAGIDFSVKTVALYGSATPRDALLRSEASVASIVLAKL
jgi:hypothetical protein